jgi:hypothetical protein
MSPVSCLWSFGRVVVDLIDGDNTRPRVVLAWMPSWRKLWRRIDDAPYRLEDDLPLPGLLVGPQTSRAHRL